MVKACVALLSRSKVQGDSSRCVKVRYRCRRVDSRMGGVCLLPDCRPHKTCIWSQKYLTDEIRWSGEDRMSGFLEQWGYAVEHLCD